MHKEINQIAQSSIDSMAFSVNKRKHNHPNSHKPPSSGKRNNYFCEHRKISGHSLERCFKIHGYPQSSKFSQDKRFAAHVSVTHASNHEALMNTDNSGSLLASHLSKSRWIFDSGVTDHMCNTIKLFTNLINVARKDHKIVIPDGNTLNVMKVGDICLTKDLFLKNVLFVPEIQFNLILVSKLTLDNKISLFFTTNAFYVQDLLMKRLLPLGNLYNGLYYTLAKDHQKVHEDKYTLNNRHIAITASCTDMTTHVKLLNLRIRYIPFSRLKVMYPDLDTKTLQENLICSICPIARQTRLAFSLSYIKSTSAFELLHVDIWGPYHTKTYSRHRMLLTIIDDFSRGNITILSSERHPPSEKVGKIVLCATYLVNRMPLVSIGNISPYERLFGSPPNNNHLRVFSCLCFTSTPKPRHTKFDSRAESYIFSSSKTPVFQFYLPMSTPMSYTDPYTPVLDFSSPPPDPIVPTYTNPTNPTLPISPTPCPAPSLF
ncbi:uncharacterized protein LOC130810866 [Amaranthus tricolor]|uniref:uncharacterized protein LOC130810866 n=1 Tax=Amaranthus tricolor TaxID=29722 RepID=UPI00258E70E0|nr:uncharacterized protein LOC130810866 [Amaranthus tricolor]